MHINKTIFCNKGLCFFLIFMCLNCINGFSFGYQYEGFLEYEESDGQVFFDCRKKCSIVLGEIGNSDFLNINGKVNGSGNLLIFYGNNIKGSTLFGYNISEDEMYHSKGDYINYEKSLYDLPNKDWILSINFFGNVKGNLDIDVVSMSFYQKFLDCRKDFRTMESLYPTSMNFREGISIRGKGILEYGYGIFVFLFLLIVIFYRQKIKEKFKIILYIGLGLFLFIGIRNTVTYTYILSEGLSGFKVNKEFFDLGDYISFVEKVREKLGLNFEEKKNCKIYLEPYGNRNIDDHGSFYFKPCKQVYDGNFSDYKVYYKTEIPSKDLDKKVLLEFNGSYLLENNSK